MVDFEENKNLVYTVYKQYFSTLDYLKDDILQCGFLGLWKACLKFDDKREIAFSSFAIKCIKNEILMFLRTELKHKNVISLNLKNENGDELDISEIIIDEKNINNYENIILKNHIIENCHNKETIKLFLHGFNQKEIAKKLGVSQTCVSRRIQRDKKRIKESLEIEK